MNQSQCPFTRSSPCMLVLVPVLGTKHALIPGFPGICDNDHQTFDACSYIHKLLTTNSKIIQMHTNMNKANTQ